MLFETPTQWAILALVLLLGWVLGLMSRSGGGRWKRELKDERTAWAIERKDYEDRLRANDTRITTLERQTPVVPARSDPTP